MASDKKLDDKISLTVPAEIETPSVAPQATETSADPHQVRVLDPVKLSIRLHKHFKAMEIEFDPDKPQPKKEDLAAYLAANADDIAAIEAEAEEYLGHMANSDPNHTYVRGIKGIMTSLRNIKQEAFGE